MYMHSANIKVCPYSQQLPPRAVTFSWWGNAYLSDSDSFAGWSYYTPVRDTQVRQIER